MKFRYLMLAAAAASAPLQAKTAPRAAAPVQTNPAARQQLCDRLAAALTPDNAIPKQADSIVAALLQAMLKQDAGFAAMNQKYPGMTDAIGVRVRPLLIEGSQATLPLYRTELSQLYCDTLTTAEARAAAAFFESADGQAMLSSATASLEYSASITALVKGGEASSSDLRSDARAAARQTAADMSEVRKQRVGQFFSSSVGQKLIALGPRKSALDQKWFNYSPPGMEDKVAAATAGAMVDHIAKTDPALAARLHDMMVEKGILPKS